MVQRGGAAQQSTNDVTFGRRREKNPGSVTNKADIAALPLHMSDVVIGKPPSHCLGSSLTKMDKHGLGIRTDAVRHGAFDLH